MNKKILMISKSLTYSVIVKAKNLNSHLQKSWCWWFVDMKGPIFIHFTLKDETVIGENYCKLLRSLKTKIKPIKHSKLSKGMFLIQHNVKQNTAYKTIHWLHELLDHTKQCWLGWLVFYEEVMKAVQNWLNIRPKSFCQ